MSRRKTTIVQQMQAVQNAARRMNPLVDEEHQALLDAHHTLSKLQRKATNTDPCYKSFVEAWCEQYPTLGFNKVAGQKIKALIETSRQIVRERNAHPEISEDEKAIGIFHYILDYVKRTNHWCHGKSITTFESKYREIYTEIVHGKQHAVSKKQSVFGRVGTL